MNKIISWIKSISLRQILTVFLVALTVFTIQSFTSSNTLQAQADTVKSPEGIYYKGTPDNRERANKDKGFFEQSKYDRKEASAEYGRRRPTSGETVKTPEGVYYKARPDSADKGETGNILEKAQQNLQETAENVKEKLNLDEPVPQSTKDFFRGNNDNRINR
jgi:ABC-type dipeptide/oligopeptide/nickel transport system permease component